MEKSPPQIFNRRLVRQRRARSAANFSDFDFLHRRAMEDIIDRLETVKRDFPQALFDGAGGLPAMLTPACGVGVVFSMDSAAARLDGAGAGFVADSERMPLRPQSLDLMVSLLTLHTANDFIGALAQARAALKPDGLFIAAVFGGDTLQNLRSALYTAETEITGGVAARIAPFAAIQDFGRALTRAGFALPVTDVDKVSITYREPARLLRDLRGMGETNVLARQQQSLSRTVVNRMLEVFTASGGCETFDIVYLTGWAPHASQQKPLKPGSATASLAEAIKKSTQTN
jgi:NADH dehydrogenase [ubiquinone] 1 alpha subcomplex assembly factor 5